MSFQLLNAHIAQRSNGGHCCFQEPNPLFAFFAPFIVLIGRQLVADHGVANHQSDIGGNWNQAAFERTAVQEYRVARFAMTSDELVHDAAACADILIFCALTQ